MILFGGVATARELARKGVRRMHFDQFHIDYGSVAEPVGGGVDGNEVHKDLRARRIGLWALFFGLLISGFGDLLRGLF